MSPKRAVLLLDSIILVASYHHPAYNGRIFLAALTKADCAK